MITQERKEETLKGLKDGTIVNENVYLEYDKNGNWNRNYLDMSIPMKYLALPRNEIEEALFLERVERVTIPYLKRRLLCKSPIPLQEIIESYDPDYDDPNAEVFVESFKKRDELTPYNIFLYQWQNRDWTSNTKEEKVRPVVVWKSDIEDQLLVIEITSQSKTYRKYQVLIKDWKTIGLKKKSWVRVDNTNILDEDLIRSRSRIGRLTRDTIREVAIKIEQFDKHFEEDPWDFMCWLKCNQIKLYALDTIMDEPLISDYNKIKGSPAITSFNLAYLFYKCAKKNEYKTISRRTK